MRKYLLLLFALISASVFGAETADQLLGRAATKYKNAKSISASYSLSANGGVSSGKITVSGNRFFVSQPELEVWYDGRTQWAYSPSANEVNITTPTAAELQQVNPFAVISAFRQSYNAAYLGAQKGTTRRLVLTPKAKKAEITRVEVVLNTTTLFPSQITINDRSKHKFVITVKGISEGKSLPAATFQYNKRIHPTAEIVDLR